MGLEITVRGSTGAYTAALLRCCNEGVLAVEHTHRLHPDVLYTAGRGAAKLAHPTLSTTVSPSVRGYPNQGAGSSSTERDSGGGMPAAGCCWPYDSWVLWLLLAMLAARCIKGPSYRIHAAVVISSRSSR